MTIARAIEEVSRDPRAGRIDAAGEKRNPPRRVNSTARAQNQRSLKKESP
jgi:hypothetical protein